MRKAFDDSGAEGLVMSVSVGIHALINVHEYHCIAIRMRCWLVDVFFLLFSAAVLTVYARFA
jgi:hypothetical protein